MSVEPEYSHLQQRQDLFENKEDREIELSWLKGIGLTRKQILDWYYHSNVVSIPMMLKDEASSPRIFGGAASFFRALCSKMTEIKKMLVKLLHHKERKMQQREL